MGAIEELQRDCVYCRQPITLKSTLEGEAGFYGDDDPNCCPSHRLVFRLRLNGESLVLLHHAVARSDAP
jgi:hypothetical protein